MRRPHRQSGRRIRVQRLVRRFERNDQLTQDVLDFADVQVSLDEIARWTDKQCEQAEDWAGAVHFRASDNPVHVPPMPAFLPANDQAH